MFKNRSITIKVNKDAKDATTEVSEDKSFENKTEAILEMIEDLGVKIFVGVVIYVILDTRRQVAVANAVHRPR